MDSTRKTALIVGVLFILTFIMPLIQKLVG